MLGAFPPDGHFKIPFLPTSVPLLEAANPTVPSPLVGLWPTPAALAQVNHAWPILQPWWRVSEVVVMPSETAIK